MKKQISMLLATACAASLLAACGGSGSTAASASAADSTAASSEETAADAASLYENAHKRITCTVCRMWNSRTGCGRNISRFGT